jgi:hypothetical protein
LKKTFTTITILLGSLTGFSQTNFYKLGIGFNAGVSTAYTGLSYTGDEAASDPDATKDLSINKSKAFGGSIDYYFTPFINAGIEYNMVQLKDGPDQYERQFVSDFSAIEFRANVSAGQFFDFSYSPLLYSLRTLNVGLGFGVVSGKNNVEDWDSGLKPSRQHGNDIGKKEFSNVFTIPASIGYNFNFYNAYDEAFLQLGLNYKVVFTTSDDIDGFNDDPTIFSNKAKDIYTTLGVSLKYMFGPRRVSFR